MAGILLVAWTMYLILAPSTSNASPAPQNKSHDFRRKLLGLDKCNACIGTSICKKFFKDEIRFARWMSAQPNLSSEDLQSYEGNYSDNTAGLRPVVLSHLMSPLLHEISDNSICTSADKGKSCSIEAILRATPRFQSWVRSNLLLPSMVKGLATPMLRCPSQRLLDRIVRRYFEVIDVGSMQMKHFTEKDKLRLLYTLAVNQQPLILQMFPGTEGWPFLRYHGSCGRMMVWAGSRPLRSMFSSPLERRADIAYQLIHITQSLRSNSLQFNLYYTSVSEDMFGTLDDSRVFIIDTSTIGIIDLQEGSPPDEDLQSEYIDVFSCLSGSCARPPPCKTVRAVQSFILLCKHVLHNLIGPNDAPSAQLPKAAVRELAICADQSQTDQRIICAVQALKDTLRSLRPCSALYGYRLLPVGDVCACMPIN
ncbi:divergent protein kinase domain 2B isoform X2 [Xyrauchen texanus]|uniref:divergent protein kinase domain 2B isoform X2 n=1 Tax=Xyrauchen texanus TaxID=154827 RepID=UPI002241A470|nr:divergent protein kinase domain 2B isoform X2 [Xyrauchen texanus]